MLDFGDIGHAVVGVFAEGALEDLEKNRNVRHVEADRAKYRAPATRR